MQRHLSVINYYCDEICKKNTNKFDFAFFREKTAFEVELYITSMYYTKHSNESCTFLGSKKLYYPGLLYDLSVLLLF